MVTFGLSPGSAVEGIRAESKNRILTNIRRSEKKIPDRVGPCSPQAFTWRQALQEEAKSILIFLVWVHTSTSLTFPIFSCSVG